MNFYLDNFIIDDYIKMALKEDMFFGDITTDNLFLSLRNIPDFNISFNSREDGVLCGRQVFERVFKILADDSVQIQFNFQDGDTIKKDDTIATIKGNARHILKGERLALNFVQKMSGIATLTRQFQKKIQKYNCKIVDTRKNTPNFRLFEKYSVKVGSNFNHRFNLSDCTMLKDNHIALFGSIEKAVEELRKSISHAHKIEVECDTIEQVTEALNANVDIIMLDNMSHDKMKKAVDMIKNKNNKTIIEASGCVTLDNVVEIAKTGVDIISTSAIVTKAKTLDFGFDYIN